MVDQPTPHGTVGKEEFVPVGQEQLVDLFKHDILNSQQAALGFLELLRESDTLYESERQLVAKTMEALERSSRLLLQLKTALAHMEHGRRHPIEVSLEEASEYAARAVRGVFVGQRLSIDTREVSGALKVVADDLLADLLTQVLALLGESAPAERSCALKMRAWPTEGTVSVSISSEGFPLDPMVTKAMTGSRTSVARGSVAASISLVIELLANYRAIARLEPAPSGSVGAQLVIELPRGGGP